MMYDLHFTVKIKVKESDNIPDLKGNIKDLKGDESFLTIMNYIEHSVCSAFITRWNSVNVGSTITKDDIIDINISFSQVKDMPKDIKVPEKTQEKPKRSGREKLLQYRKDYYNKNKDKFKSYRAEYYQKNKEKMNAQSKAYYHAKMNKEVE